MAQFQGEGASRSSTFDLDQSEGERFSDLESQL